MNDTAVIFLIVIACCAIIIAAVCILGTALFFFRSLPLSRAHINQGRNVQEYRLEEAVITREEAEEPQTAQEISEPAVQVAAPVKTDEAQSAWTGELSERE